MKLTTNQFILTGIILFLFGLLLILLSLNNSYPLHFSEIQDPTFFQYFPTIWPGITISLIGLFITGFFSKTKIAKFLCVSLITPIYYSYIYFYQYIPTSDGGNVRAMFEIFKHEGANSAIEPYFQYPTFFGLNEITGLATGSDINLLSFLFFAIYGILISMLLFIFLSKNEKKNYYQIAFIGVFFYFIGIYSFINYQWAPQTLALVFFMALLILYDKKELKYRILSVLVFTVLVFCHAFIPVMFLIFFGFYTIKKRVNFDVFILFTWIYLMVLIYHTTYYLPDILEVFQDSLFGIGEYSLVVTRSLMEPIGLISQIISLVNRILVPIIWIVISLGFILMLIKKKLNAEKIFLGFTGGFYMAMGVFFSILGTRALQILLIPLTSSVEYYLNNWKKYFIAFTLVIIVLCVFLPMRSSYDNYFFQLEEEKEACNFLAYNVQADQFLHIGASQLSGDYVLKKIIYFNHNNRNFKYPSVTRPHSEDFKYIFNRSMDESNYLIFNPNIGKHISAYGFDFVTIENLAAENLKNNKIYESGKTYITAG